MNYSCVTLSAAAVFVKKEECSVGLDETQDTGTPRTEPLNLAESVL